MNHSFFTISEEKRANIRNAGYKEFGQNTYKKTSMNKIALEARISKSLLFYYFKNKKEFYLYLYQYALDMIEQECIVPINEDTDLFLYLSELMKKKCQLMCKENYLFLFVNQAYYEKDEELKKEIALISQKSNSSYTNNMLLALKRNKLRNETNEMMIRLIQYLATGFTMENHELIVRNPKCAMEEFQQILNSIKRNYTEI